VHSLDVKAYMRKLASFIFVLSLGASLSATAAENDLNSFLKRITAEQPSLKWDAKSAVEGDFDGSHQASFAVLGYKDKQVTVAVSHKAADGTVTAQYLAFEINPNYQNAICGLPAHLEISPPACTNGETGEKLPGCTESPGISGLTLDDDRCDPIYMYWSHDTKRMMWWRY
jgi:hypothetical protein